jgi:hypothetical protein
MTPFKPHCHKNKGEEKERKERKEAKKERKNAMAHADILCYLESNGQ